jgi:hypothetical protein
MKLWVPGLTLRASARAASLSHVAVPDQLSERARVNCLHARAMVGRELGVPAVEGTVHGQPSYTL